jgi:OmcA/MtrC family decaheme c-type cytochrome
VVGFTTTVGTLTAADLRVYLADIVPAGTTSAVTGDTWPTAYLERWAYESTSSSTVDGALSASTDNGDGTYTYTYTSGTPYTDPTFVAAPASTSHGGDPLPAATLAQVAPEMDAYGDTQRVVLRVAGVSGDYATGMAIQDFTLADSGDPATADAVTSVAPDRVLAPITGCKQCHSDNMQNAAHASSYPDTRACNICHSPISGWPHSANTTGTGYYATANAYGQDITADGAWLTRYIHQLHDGNAWFDGPAGEVTYPENIKNCAKCHNGDDNMSDAWKTNPTKLACTACHNVAADAHPNDQADNTLCAGCHTAGSNVLGGVEIGITAVHQVTTLKNAPDVSITPNYTTAIDITPPANGVDYVAGEAPTITLTATNADGAMDPANFTAARLYVYGPRAKSLPVLTPGSSTDSAYIAELAADPTATPTQGVNLLSDPAATIDATSISYTLQAIPDGMTAGTYMVMAYLTDPSSRQIAGGHTYNIDGWQLTTIKINTDTDTPRVAGTGCNKCHDLNDWTSTAHRAYFGTDGCLACHDQSGNHADTIANRVHAVHSASVKGDLNDRDWSEITYPSALTNCEVCHNSGDTTYKAPDDANQPSQWAKPCIGCHGDTPGAADHMIQNGGALPTE